MTVFVDGWGYLYGIGPADPDDPCKPLAELVEDQTRKVFANLDRILAARGLTRTNVVAVRVHLNDYKRLFERMDVVYAGYFAGVRAPARSCIGVVALTRGAQVEMDFVVRE